MRLLWGISIIVAKYTAIVKIPVSVNPLNPTIKNVSDVLARTLKNCPAKRYIVKLNILPLSLLVTLLIEIKLIDHSLVLIIIMNNEITGIM